MLRYLALLREYIKKCVRRKRKSKYGKIQRNFITESHALKVHFRAQHQEEEEIEAKIDEKRKRKKFMFLSFQRLFFYLFSNVHNMKRRLETDSIVCL